MKTDNLSHIDIINIVHRNPMVVFVDEDLNEEISGKEVQEIVLSQIRVGATEEELRRLTACYKVKSFNGGKDDKAVPPAQRKGGL